MMLPRVLGGWVCAVVGHRRVAVYRHPADMAHPVGYQLTLCGRCRRTYWGPR